MEDNTSIKFKGSELVTFLGLTDPEEIRDILGLIHKKFGYRLKLIPSNYDYFENPGIIVDPKKIDVIKDARVLTFAGLVLDDNNHNLNMALEERQISHKLYNQHKDDNDKLRYLVTFASGKTLEVDQQIMLVLMSDENSFVELKYECCPGLDNTPGLSLQATENRSYNEYPLLGDIYLLNPKKFKYKTFAEGASKDFEEWLGIRITGDNEKLINWLKTKNYEEHYIKDFNFNKKRG